MVSDAAGGEYQSVEIRFLLTNYTTEILSLWTKEFGCYIASLVLLYIMQDQYRVAKETGKMSPSVGYTVRALEQKSGIPKSTISAKLKYLEKLGVIKLGKGSISIAYTENGASALQIKLPRGKTITDNHITQLRATIGAQKENGNLCD